MDIRKYEAMAKLELSGDEREWVSGLADKLLKSLPALDAVNTDGVEPLVTVLNIQNVFRADVAVKAITRDELLSNAPEQYDGYFQVPKALG